MNTKSAPARTATAGGRHGGMISMQDQLRLIEPQKRCPGCGETKPLAEYHVDRSKNDGRCIRCTACHSARTKALWADPKARAQMSEANSRWHRENADRNYERTRRWRLNRGEEYDAIRRAAGVPTAGTVQYHAERLIVLERDDGVCGICGEDADPLRFDLDHIVPTSRGGLHVLSNLQLAHRSCNARKATA